MNKKKMKKLNKKRDALCAELARLNDFKGQVQKELGYVEERRMAIKRDFKEVQKQIQKTQKKINKLSQLNGESVCCSAPY